MKTIGEQLAAVDFYLTNLKSFYSLQKIFPKNSQDFKNLSLNNLFYIMGSSTFQNNGTYEIHDVVDLTLKRVIFKNEYENYNKAVMEFYKRGYTPEFYNSFINYCLTIQKKLLPSELYYNMAGRINLQKNKTTKVTNKLAKETFFHLDIDGFLKNYQEEFPMGWNIELALEKTSI